MKWRHGTEVTGGALRQLAAPRLVLMASLTTADQTNIPASSLARHESDQISPALCISPARRQSPRASQTLLWQVPPQVVSVGITTLADSEANQGSS